MAISRARKEELVAEYRNQLEESNGVLFANYTGLTVAQMESLRRKVREQEGQVFVPKNTLLKLVLTDIGMDIPEDLLIGPTVVAFCHQDVPPLAKLFRDFSKEVEEERFAVKGAMMEAHFYAKGDAIKLADMPSRDEMLAQVLRTINAPATQITGVVASGVRQVLNVIKAYADKLEEAAGSPAEAGA